jgi:protein-S-isoprenylcysteine O-methyltransferase Ste14
VRGVYRHVRNPMISGVALALFGEALVLLSRPHLVWALAFLGINGVYVPRLLPRARPWRREAMPP